MPCPVSETVSSSDGAGRPFCDRTAARTVMVPGGSVASIALVSRFRSTWRSAAASAGTVGRSRGTRFSRARSRPATRDDTMVSASVTSSASATGARSSSRSRVRSSTLRIVSIMRWTWDSMIASFSRSSAGQDSRCSSCV